jgi:hypothetical protein
MTAVLVPLLRWVNGPPVTADQELVQALVLIAALIGGLVLRLYQIRVRR